MSYVSCWIVSCPAFPQGTWVLLTHCKRIKKKSVDENLWAAPFAFGLNVAISNVTMLRVEYCGDRVNGDTQESLFTQKPFTLSPSRWASQIDSFPVRSDITFMFTTADSRILDKNKMPGRNVLFYPPPVFPDDCLLPSKHIWSCCLLFFILFHSSNHA